MAFLDVYFEVVVRAPTRFSASRGLIARHDATIETQARCIVAALREDGSVFSAPEVSLYVPRSFKRYIRQFRASSHTECVEYIESLRHSFEHRPYDESAQHCVVGLFAFLVRPEQPARSLSSYFFCDRAITLASSVRVWDEACERLRLVRPHALLCSDTHQAVKSILEQERHLRLAHHVLRRHPGPSLGFKPRPAEVELLIHFVAIAPITPDRKVMVFDALPDVCGIPRATTAMFRARIVQCLLQTKRISPYGDVVLDDIHKRTDISELNLQLVLRANAYACSCEVECGSVIHTHHANFVARHRASAI